MRRWLALALLLVTTTAHAEELVAPKLIEDRPATYPTGHTERATVVLELTIAADGTVSAAKVTTSAGDDFDNAAIEAAKELLFTPAMRDGAPIEAKIAFRYDLEPPAAAPLAAPPPAPATPPPATIPAVAPPPSTAPVTEVFVEGPRPPREPTKHVIDGAALRKTPGTNGDALRAVENLPGVARPPGLSGALIIRGASPQDSMVFVDGTWIPVVYHFGGVSSVIPSDLLQKIEFYPGNFSAEFGRAMGGIVDVGLRSPRRDRLGGVVQVDLLDGRIIAEGPLSSRTRFLVAGRRSYVDAWIGPYLRAAGNDIRTAPRYYDFQAMLEHDVSERTTARATFFGSDDRLAVVVDGPSAGDPVVSGTFAQSYTFYRAQLRTDARITDDVRFINMVSYGSDVQKLTLGSNRLDVSLGLGNARSDLRAKLSREVTFIAGADVMFVNYDVTIRFPPVPTEDTPGPFFGRPAREVHGRGSSIRPAVYAMLDLSPLKGLKILPGLRVDLTPETKRVDLDPRLAIRARVVNGTTLKGAVGIFHQPPLQESVRPWGDGTLRSNVAYHASAGVEQAVGPLELSVEGFYKHLHDLITPRAAETSTESGIAYDNGGSGRVYGAEALLKWKGNGRFFGWLAYTLSRSERREMTGQPLHLFQYDQTHILAAVGSYDLGRGWTVGGRFRFVSGSPYTPYRGGAVDLDAGAYEPIMGRPYSARVAPFHRLDVRVEKAWNVGGGRVAAYLDVQNVYNRANPEGLQYSFDYSKSTVAAGLPLLPVLGLRGEL